MVTLKVFDILGKEVTVLANEEKLPGSYTVRFNGNGLSSGLYIYRIQAGRHSASGKMMLIR
jgi:hypothetical protein